MSHSNSSYRPKFRRALTFPVACSIAFALGAPACSSLPEEKIGLSGGSAGASAGGKSATSGRGGTLNIGGAAPGAGGTTAFEAGAGGRGGGGILFEPGGSAGSDEAGSAGAAGVPTLDPNQACALSTDTVEALPSVLQLVIDTSGSMDWPPGWAPANPNDSKPPGATKWEITRDALSTAVTSLDAGVALGITFYPDTTDKDPDSLCLRNEVALPIGLLGTSSSKQRADWSAALAAVVPNGGTPTQGAYRFGVQQLDNTKLTGTKFLLLITDGTPTCTLDCQCTDNNVPVDSAGLIADAASALDDGVRTFVIGSPGSEDTRNVLSALARAGGTAPAGCSDDGPLYCHFDMTTQPDLAKGLASALDQVAASLRSCEYPIPAAPDNRTLDPGLVNVLFTPSHGKTKTIGRDPSKSDCNEGWQYSADGNSIVLCGAACDAAKSDVGSKVEILLGCRTVTEEPR
jgi:hypothetical protein